MRQSLRWISFVCLCIMGLFATMAGLSGMAYADTKYRVSQGDTLWTIAQTHHTSIAAIVKTNHLHSDVLQIHQALSIPGSGPRIAESHRVSMKSKPIVRTLSKRNHSLSYTVQSGDTLWAIATRNHTTVGSLCEINHLNSDVIYPGQKLKVSGAAEKLTYAIRRVTPQSVDFRIAREKGIPAELIPVYQAAGQKYDIPWTVLAAIHERETGFSTSAVYSCAGAEGPMQFMPSTFERYAVTAPENQGAPNINNVYDAIYTAAHMLAADGYAKNPTEALYQYNHSMTYVYSVESLAENYQA